MLSMTKEGANALKQVHQIMTNLQKEFFSCLSESEASEFFRLVRKLTFANHDQ
jgi:DNA-binding MarR family transcriptional regulator